MRQAHAPPASDAATTNQVSTETQTTASALTTCVKTIGDRVTPGVPALTMGALFLVVAVGPAAAQSQVGDVYCGTGVATGIDLVFGAVADLGLPATGYYTDKAGLSYMRAGGNPERKNKAKEKLVMSGVRFGIVVLALISPTLIDKAGSQMGFGFSDCVQPF